MKFFFFFFFFNFLWTLFLLYCHWVAKTFKILNVLKAISKEGAKNYVTITFHLVSWIDWVLNQCFWTTYVAIWVVFLKTAVLKFTIHFSPTTDSLLATLQNMNSWNLFTHTLHVQAQFCEISSQDSCWCSSTL